MKKIFLSASVPDPERDPKYHSTADVIAIRDAVRALAAVVLPNAKLVWGGHPAITPLIREVAQSVGVNGKEHVTLFQSKHFTNEFIDDNKAFEHIELTEDTGERNSSLKQMREEMLKSEEFDAGVFIGGMEGVEEEYEMFRELQPNAMRIPIASTGAAARRIFEKEGESIPPAISDALQSYTYADMFKRVLGIEGTRR